MGSEMCIRDRNVPNIRSIVEASVTTSFERMDSKSLSSRINKKYVRSAKHAIRMFKLSYALDPACVVLNEGGNATLEPEASSAHQCSLAITAASS